MTIQAAHLGVLLVGLCLGAGGSRAVAAPAGSAPAPAAAPAPTARSRVVLTRPLAPLDGRHLQTSAVEVTYEPGGSSAAHSHPCPVMVYVIEGAVRTQVKGEPEAIYRAGESFFEAAHGVHQVAANASSKERAKFVAFFVCDRDTPLTTVLPAAASTDK